MKKFLLILLTVSGLALAAEKPTVAVYVTGEAAENDKNALGTRIFAALVNSGRYRGIERSSAFLAKVDEEHVKQRSGAIDDNQIRTLGKQFGVEFICIATITPAFGAFQLSARIIDIETAQVMFIGESFSTLKTVMDVAVVSNEVVNKMFGVQTAQAAAPAPEPKPEAITPPPGADNKQKKFPIMLTVRITTAAIAAAGLAGGIYYDGEVKSEMKKYNNEKNPDKILKARKNADENAERRNLLYTVAAIGAGAFTITLFF